MSERGDEGFLSRWSRRKAQVRQGQDGASEEDVAPPPLRPVVTESPPMSPRPVAGASVPPIAGRARAADPDGPPAMPAVPPPTLDDVAGLTPSSDFSRFVAPDVDATVKNAAMKRLFADPHFNVMDGLDTYIDDYHHVEPLPKSMLRQMVQARALGLLDDELEDQQVLAAASAQDPEVAPDDAAREIAADVTAAGPDSRHPGAGPAPADALARIPPPDDDEPGSSRPD